MNTTTNQPKEYLTPKEAAEFLCLKLNTLYRLAIDRRIPSRKFGKMRRFKLDELREWAESKKVEAKKSR